MRDVFRPKSQPEQYLYDAFQSEAMKRDGRDYEVWVRLESEAVQKAAARYADEYGLLTPSIDQVRQASDFASGHADYGRQWACKVADCMRHNNT